MSTEEPAADGRADYLLKNSRTQPIAVIEAKRFAIDPYSAKDQAKAYAGSLGAPFVLLSNGHEHYFWDYADGDARAILGLPSQPDLERRADLKIHRRGSLANSLGAIPLPGRLSIATSTNITTPRIGANCSGVCRKASSMNCWKRCAFLMGVETRRKKWRNSAVCTHCLSTITRKGACSVNSFPSCSHA